MRRLVLISAYIAALTSSWTSLSVGGLEIGNVTLGLALVSSVALRLVSGQRVHRLPVWSLVPAVTAIGLLWFHTVALGLPVLRPVELLTLGTGVSPAVFLLRVTVSSAVVALFLSNLADLLDRAETYRVLWFYVAGAVASALYALCQANDLGFLAPLQSQIVGVGRYPGLGSHPNALAQSAVLSACLLAGLPVRTIPGALLRGAAAVACGYAIFISGSRAGLIAALLIVIALVVRYVAVRSRGPLRVALIMVCSAAFVYGTVAVLSVSRLAGSDVTAEQSDDLRTASILSGIQLFADHPFTGSGLGIWLGESVPIVLLSSGGLVLFAAYTAYMVRAGAMALRSGAVQPGLRSVAVLTLCSLAILWILNNNLFERYTLWTVLTLAFLWRTHAREESSSPGPGQRLLGVQRSGGGIRPPAIGSAPAPQRLGPRVSSADEGRRAVGSGTTDGVIGSDATGGRPRRFAGPEHLGGTRP